MHKIITLCLLSLILSIFTGCSRRNEAIDLVRKSKMKDTELSIEEVTMKWAEDFAKQSIIYEWKAKKSEINNKYLVGFVEKNTDRGYYWEADLNNKIVLYIHDNKFLSLKYGFSRLKYDSSFTIESIKVDTLKFKYEQDWYTKKWINKGIYYTLKASVRNNTDKTITWADIKGTVFVIFGVEKILEMESSYGSGFDSIISKSNSWKPNAVRSFYIKTELIDQIYKDYQPTNVFCEIEFEASDPIGYKYEGVIKKIDLKWEFEK